MQILRLLLILLIFSVEIVSAQDESPVLTLADTVRVSEQPLDAISVSPDGVFIATGGRDNLIRVWEMTEGDELLILELDGHSDRVVDLTFSPDGRLLASASADTSVHVWDVFSLISEGIESSNQPITTITHHSDIVTGVAFSPDGMFLASSSWDASVWIGLPESGDTVVVLEHFDIPVWELEFVPDDSFTLATAGEDGAIWLWGLGDNSSLTNLNGHDGPIMSMSFNGDGSALVSGGMDGRVQYWDLTIAEPEPRELGTHLAPVTGVSLSPQSEVTISASLDGTVRVWDVMLDVEINQIRENGLPLTALDGIDSQFVSVGTEGMMRVWHVDESIAIAQRPTEPVVVSAPITEENNNTDDSTRVDVAPQTETVSDASQETTTIIEPASPEIPAQGTWISIPIANITSPVTQFPLDGVSWAIDPWENNVGYLQGTAWFNQNGNTVLGGHSEYPNGQAGIFFALYNVGVGDVIIVGDNGNEYQYRVVDIRVVNYTDLTVVYPTDFSRLTLITCDVPSFSAIDNVYYERLVVIADLIG